MKEIIKDIEKLQDRADEIDVRKENNEMREIILALKEVVRANNLKGLSAPQIGYNKRIFVINFNGDIRTFVNPIITEVKGFGLSREKCSSLDKEYIRPRNNNISVVYQTPLGKTESVKLVGKAAEVFQHELDHLDGLLLSDIGLELTEEFDSMDEHQKVELINEYMDSLDIQKKKVDQEIKEDKDLKQMSDAIDFMKDLQSGKVELGEAVSTKKEDEEK